MLPINLADTTCWVIFVSACITGGMATLGLASSRYKDTFPETITLGIVAVMASVVVAQIYEYGYTKRDGIASLTFAIALYSLAHGVTYFNRRK